MSKEEIRSMIWNLLESTGLARFPRPIHGRIPNFIGAEIAAEKVATLPEFLSAKTIFCNPDSPQLWVRRKVLNHGKKLIMATPRLKRGFLVLDPEIIKQAYYAKASTIRGAFKYGILTSPWDLPKIDLKITGSVAVTTKGARLGKGEGFAEIEAGILGELGKIDRLTKIVTTVHELQIVDQIPQKPYDVPVDIIITSKGRIIHTNVEKPEPKILWHLLPESKLEEISLLKKLKNR